MQPSSTHTSTVRELAQREQDGIHVALLWHPDDDAVTVSIGDVRSGVQIEFGVEAERALDAFRHPYAYAA
jgi:hypothetical protein